MADQPQRGAQFDKFMVFVSRIIFEEGGYVPERQKPVKGSFQKTSLEVLRAPDPAAAGDGRKVQEHLGKTRLAAIIRAAVAG